MCIITIGIDLAKNIFAVHGVNEHGKVELVALFFRESLKIQFHCAVRKQSGGNSQISALMTEKFP